MHVSLSPVSILLRVLPLSLLCVRYRRREPISRRRGVHDPALNIVLPHLFPSLAASLLLFRASNRSLQLLPSLVSAPGPAREPRRPSLPRCTRLPALRKRSKLLRRLRPRNRRRSPRRGEPVAVREISHPPAFRPPRQRRTVCSLLSLLPSRLLSSCGRCCFPRGRCRRSSGRAVW